MPQIITDLFYNLICDNLWHLNKRIINYTNRFHNSVTVHVVIEGNFVLYF